MKITEFKQRNNVHQTHFEDLVLLGSDGLDELNDKIERFIKYLDGEKSIILKNKIDGAPAIQLLSKVPGYPENCIGLKSLIGNPDNAITSVQQIDNKYYDRPGMANKLIYGLRLSECIPAGEIWQADCLFTSEDLREETINNVKYLTFHPNKIVYAISEDSEAYDKIKNSKFGICMHTIYKNGSQSFDIDLNNLQNVPDDIYVIAPPSNFSNKKVDYNVEGILNKYSQLLNVESSLINNSEYEDLCNNQLFMKYWNTFENSRLADRGETNINLNTFMSDLRQYISQKQELEYNNKVSKLKTQAGIQSATNKYQAEVSEIDQILSNNSIVLVNMVKALNLASDIKSELLIGLNKSDLGYNSFYKHRYNGFIPSKGEGISMSDSDGNIVKLVDRSKFSNANRNPDYLSGFQHEGLEEDTVKTRNGQWTNRGKEGTHGTFKTKKQADAQRKAMFANGYSEDYSGFGDIDD